MTPNPNPADPPPPAIEIVRLPEYDAQLKKMLPRQDHREAFDQAVDAQIAASPDCGVVISGTGGFRKMRAARPDVPTGKRDGARVIYLHVPTGQIAFITTVYAKSQSDNLSERGKSALRLLAELLKEYKPLPSHRKPTKPR